MIQRKGKKSAENVKKGTQFLLIRDFNGGNNNILIYFMHLSVNNCWDSQRGFAKRFVRLSMFERKFDQQ